MDEKRKQADRRAVIAMTNTVGQIGCMTTLASAVIIGISFFIGMWLDQLLETDPWLTVGAVVASFPITLFVIVRLSLTLMDRAQRQREKILREIERESDNNLSES